MCTDPRVFRVHPLIADAPFLLPLQGDRALLNMEVFGRRLAFLRHHANLKQRDLAERCCVSVQAVSKWERGLSCPDILILDDIAAVLGVEVKDLFTLENIG